MSNTRKYICSYRHKGSEWSVEIMADNLEDAEARVAKLGCLRLDGEHVVTIPGWVPVRMMDIVCRAQNLLGSTGLLIVWSLWLVTITWAVACITLP